jgi:hypothetical protein
METMTKREIVCRSHGRALAAKATIRYHRSLATSLYRAAMTGFVDAIFEVKNSGRFLFLDRCASTQELLNMMRI